MNIALQRIKCNPKKLKKKMEILATRKISGIFQSTKLNLYE